MKIEWTSDTPEIDEYGIAVDIRKTQNQSAIVNVMVYVLAVFPKNSHFIETWIKSLFLTVTSDSNLVLYHGNLTRDIFVFSEEIKMKKLKNGTDAYQLALSIDLMDEIGEKLENDKYYICVSSCQYQSKLKNLEFEE